MYIVTIVRCIRTDSFPIHEIGTLEKVSYDSRYVVNGVHCTATRLCHTVFGLYFHSVNGYKLTSNSPAEISAEFGVEGWIDRPSGVIHRGSVRMAGVRLVVNVHDEIIGLKL